MADRTCSSFCSISHHEYCTGCDCSCHFAYSYKMDAEMFFWDCWSSGKIQALTQAAAQAPIREQRFTPLWDLVYAWCSYSITPDVSIVTVEKYCDLLIQTVNDRTWDLAELQAKLATFNQR